MDAADRDIGASGVALLDPTVFKGTGVARIAVTIGKNGKAYILNADGLGGFKQGPGGTDGVLQTITASNAVFGGVGSYPLEGGYI
jgi:iron transport multicopper oxidase